ncbi:hypothetical protein E3N88_06629 [Mikania micrantha]|uniref:Uncharacterized protein n=1 Tax=Mikania micrantha TaxID=192012 RepID=A0A5N6PP95_9ASTR|nr:hypothetical protein E3N88_06629 [Mikania micrantha]
MESSKDQVTKIDENPRNTTADNPVDPSFLPAAAEENDNPNRPSRTPFTNLSQVDADLALARTLQDQERAYMMLRMNGGGSDHESWETGSYLDDDEFDEQNSEYDGSDAEEGEEEEEDAFDVHAHLDIGSRDDDRSIQGVELNPASFPNDEAYARALQDAEDREMAARLLALTGINGMVSEEEDDMDDHDGNSQNREPTCLVNPNSPHFGQPAVEAFTRGGAPGPVNIAYSGVYQWWYTIGLRTNEDLYIGVLHCFHWCTIKLTMILF